MNNLYQNELISSLCAVYEYKGKYLLEDFELQLEIKEDIDRIRFFFGVDNNTALVMAVLLCEQIAGNKFNVNQTMKFLGFKTINILEVNNALHGLKKKGWMVPNKSHYEVESLNDYYFSKEIMNAILLNDKKLLEIIVPDNIIKAMFSIMKFLKNAMADPDNEFLVDSVLKYVEHFRCFPIIDTICTNDEITYNEKVVLFYIMAFTTVGIDEFDLNYELDKFCEDPSFPYVFKNRVRSDKSILFKEGYLEFMEPFLADFSRVCLGERLRDELDIKDSDVKKPFTPKLSHVILPDSISEKKLFFNNENQQQIEEVFQLTSDAYNEVMARFEEQGMQQGLTLLFHGAAGTGKTELVKQIAKQNNRVILMVEMSQLHSMFVGQSEKNIKKLFSEYKSAMQYYERTPILLFNEADAIISKRGVVEKSVDQMYNTVQNTLLQELEDFKGIFIATTNMLINIDTAFDRRMLYKLQFEKPNKETRFSILKQSFDTMNDDLLLKACKDYSLTGGQIDNVKRRWLAEQLLFGTETSNAEKFFFYVQQETNYRKTDKPSIGFS
ncbi:MAG: ATP-binding protein [Flavobacterium sp.]